MSDEDAEVARAPRRRPFDRRGGRRRPTGSGWSTSDPDAYDRFYNVVANPMLWFIQHYLWDLSNAPDIRQHEVRGVRGGLLRGERGPRARGARGDRGRGGGRRDAPRLPPLRGAEVHPPGAAGPLPPPLRPHPVDAAGRVARAARRHARGHLRGDPLERHHRLPHALLPAQLPALLPRAVRPRGGRGGGRRALRRARRVGALLPAADLGRDVPARPPSGRRCTSTSARSCAAGAST